MPERELKLKNIFIAGFLFSLHLGLTAYINSSLLASFVGETSSGVIYTLGSLTAVLALGLAPFVLRKTGSYKFLLILSLVSIASLSLFTLAKSIYTALPSFVLHFALNAVIAFTLDEMLEIFSKKSAEGTIRGLYLTILSLAWVMAQVLGSSVLRELPIKAVYFSAIVVFLLFFFLSATFFRNIPDPKYSRDGIRKYIGKFFHNPNLARSYKINFLLQFFYSWMVIYTPIYLHSHIGFSWSEIGIIFAIMLTPFVILQFPLGKYSDKVGERSILMLGFTILSLATTALFFIQGAYLWLWAGALFATRIGAAMIEVMSDVYFFKHMKVEDDEYVGIYRNATPLSYILGPMVAYLVFSVTPEFKFMFPVLGAITLYGIYLASTIRKSDI